MCLPPLRECVDTKRDNYRQGGKCFLLGNGSFIIQIIAQIIIISENFLNKSSRLKNCILFAEHYYHHSGVG